MSDSIKTILAILVFVVSLSLVVIGQRNVGYTGLAMEFVGLFGLIGCLWSYNKKYK